MSDASRNGTPFQPRLAARLDAVSLSPTFAVMMAAGAARARGVDVIDFGPGEPDFDTPENVKRAGARAIADNLTHYTDISGILELRRAIAARYRDEWRADWSEQEIITGCGGKNVLFLIAQALFEPGDRVALYAPYWVSFPEQVRLCGAEPVILHAREEDGFIPRARDLEPHAGRLKAVILNTPCNPSGAVIPDDEIERFAEFAARHDLVVISDETYDTFHYGPGAFASFASRASRLRDRLVIVNSFSKTYAMTGWRVGYALGPRTIVDAARKVQSHDATHTAAISQAAALEALRGPQDSVAAMREEYRKRRDAIVGGLRDVRGFDCRPPAGSFYVFPGVAGAQRRLDCPDTIAFAKRLLEECGVATVPGEAFGTPAHLRLSYALAPPRILEGIDRLKRLLGGTGS